MRDVAEELRKEWDGLQAGLLDRRTGSLTAKPWKIGVVATEEARKEGIYDRTVLIDLTEDGAFTLLDTMVPHRPREVASGMFSMEMSSPQQVAQTIARRWSSAHYSPY